MGKKITSEPTIEHFFSSHNIAKEFQQISDLLDSIEGIYSDIAHLIGKPEEVRLGRTGMSIESTVRCAILKHYWQLPYKALAFHLLDSDTFRAFARLPMNFTPKSSTLQANISQLTEDIWRYLNHKILDIAVAKKVEKGRKVRIDTTAVETNIISPTDSHLLYTAICKGVKLLKASGNKYINHKRKSKKLFNHIRNCKRKKEREGYYKQLLDYAGKTLGYLHIALQSEMSEYWQSSIHTLCQQLAGIISQSYRRVILGENVKPEEKVTSLHEPHTDIIRKGGRETVFGHKVNFVTGSSGMVLGVDILRGNPADSTLLLPALEEVIDVYKRSPRQIAADGGFASLDNLKEAKNHGIKDIAFHKRCGLKVIDMCKSNWVYTQLIKFRAGIEGNISFLKRVFGLNRCNWRGWDGFQSYVMSAVVTYNLVLLSRKLTE